MDDGIRGAGRNAESVFWMHLTAELLKHSNCFEQGNVDPDRFKSAFSWRNSFRERFLRWAASRGFYRRPDIRYEVLGINGLDRAYGLLADQQSRNVFVQILAYHILGHENVRLPLNTPQHWKLRQSMSQYVEKRHTRNHNSAIGPLDLCHINGQRFQATQLDVLNTFVLEQYRCRRADIGVKPGDVVIEGGGCLGDTALYFAQNAEHVFCFESMPSNVEIIRENLAMNPVLAHKITVVQKALWRCSGESIDFQELGPGSRPTSKGKGLAVETQSIDDFVAQKALDRVDFIKMDIEGCELDALAGSERTIRGFKPQLAICIYHDPSHFALIPNWLDSLNLGYRFLVDHFTFYDEETVLYASARPPSHENPLPPDVHTLDHNDYSLEFFNEVNMPLIKPPVRVPRSGEIRLVGWAVDRANACPALAIQAVIDGTSFDTSYGYDRPDVASYFKQPAFRSSGFVFQMPAARVPPGEHQLRLGIRTANGRRDLETGPFRFIVE